MIGYVIYTDGGCRPNPDGYGGGGIHAYRWDSSLGNKGIGHATHAATTTGYEAKSAASDFAGVFEKKAIAESKVLPASFYLATPYKVVITEYLDCYKPLGFGSSNNSAELEGAIEALENFASDIFADNGCTVVLRIDSRYVVDNVNGNLKNWVANNMVGMDGVSQRPNARLWLKMHGVLERYAAQGIHPVFLWIKGHGTCIGNDSADSLATMGVFQSRFLRDDQLQFNIRKSAPDNYWATGADDRHPLLTHRYQYFNTDDASEVRGYSEYYLSNQGKDVELIAKKTPDAAVAVVRLKKPDAVIEFIGDFQKSLPRDVDYLCKVDLDSVYGKAMRYIRLYGKEYLTRVPGKRICTASVDGLMLAMQLQPPFLASRLVDTTLVLSDILDKYLSRDEDVVTTVITDSLYDVTLESVKVKKGEEPRTKQVCKLKASIPVGYNTHNVTVAYKNATGELEHAPVRMTLSVDCVDRNNLRRLEDLSPKISIVTWKAGPDVFMYATVIEVGEEVGIWAASQSNMRVIDKAKTPA